MNSNIIRLLFPSCLFALIAVSTARAQVQRTFVSGVGVDGGACSRIAPCRTFSAAIAQTNPGGEVVVLDSAGYGAFSILHALSIVAPPGVYAGISVFSGNGVTVNGGSSDVIILRGLTVNNQGSSGNGVYFQSGGLLHVESCVVHGFSSNVGLLHQAAGTLELKDSILRHNGAGLELFRLAANIASATIDRTRFEGNVTNGIYARDGSTLTVRNSLASGNGGGFTVESRSSKSSELNIENCIASYNGTGVAALTTSTGVAIVRVSNSTITDNLNSGIIANGANAVALSRVNNTLAGNNPDITNILGGTVGSYPGR